MPEELNLQSRIALRDRGEIPVLGFGVYQMTDGAHSMETMISALKMDILIRYLRPVHFVQCPTRWLV